jgi:adenylate cyclase
VVAKLNELFHRFDELADRHGLEKIKTIGDAYMVVGGLPSPQEGHERAMAQFALDMMKATGEVEKEEGDSFSVRIGIHCGPVVAGVIGSRKFAYDLWGDTVNVASRLESHGVPGMAQVSSEYARCIRRWFELEGPVLVALKGKGEVETFFLVGPR